MPVPFLGMRRHLYWHRLPVRPRPRRRQRSGIEHAEGIGIGNADNIPAFIEKVNDKNSDLKLVGSEHRVFKNSTWRAVAGRRRLCVLRVDSRDVIQHDCQAVFSLRFINAVL